MKFENIRVFNFENALRGMRNPKNSWHLSDSKYGATFNSFDYGELAHNMYVECLKMKYPNCDIEELLTDKKDEDLLKYLLNNGITHTYDNGIIEYALIGPKDMRLAKTLIKSGPEHRKFLRQIFVTVDITAPLYWWKEFDTYKVGTVANSTSTMHKLLSKPITIDCFEIDDYKGALEIANGENTVNACVESIINFCESLRQECLDIKQALTNDMDMKTMHEYQESFEYYWKELVRWLPDSWLQTRTVTMNYENLLAMCSKSQRRFHKLNEWSGKRDASLNTFINFSRNLPYAQDFIFYDETLEVKSSSDTDRTS